MIDIYYELINKESNNKAHCRSSLIAPWILNKMLLNLYGSKMLSNNNDWAGLEMFHCLHYGVISELTRAETLAMTVK